MSMPSPCPALPALIPGEFSFVSQTTCTPIPGQRGRFLLEVQQVAVTGEEALFLHQCAAELGCSVKTVQRLCTAYDEGRVPGLRSYRPGLEHRRVKRRWLEEYKRSRGIV